MNRPRLTAVANEVAVGTAIDPMTILSILMSLLPLLQTCAGGPDAAAGWLRGDDLPFWVFKRARVRWRERLVWRKVMEHTDARLVADRVVERLKRATPLEMIQVYGEAGK